MSKKTVDIDRAQKALEREREDALLARNHLPMFAEFFLRWERDPKRRIQLVDMHIEMMMDALKYRDLVIMASPGFGKCAATGSPVHLADGRQVPIESLTTRTKIVLFDPVAFEQRIAWAGPVIDNGVRDCVRITLQSGRVQTVTLNHPLWTVGGWRMAGALSVGEALGVVRNISLPGALVDLADINTRDNILWDGVVSIELVRDLQTWGIEVDDPSHCYISDNVLSHNTNLVTYALTIWEAGHRPETYTSIVGSKLRTTAFGFTRTIRNYIENNEWVRMCFPNLRPSLDRWSIEELEVAVHNKAIKDPTWRAIGNDAGWQGSRHSRQVFDDMIDGVLARSKMLCEQQAEWVHSGFDRLDLDNGGKRVFIQNRFRRWDTGQILVDKHKWHLHMACIRDPVTKKTRFPEKFPQEELDNWPPTLAALQLDCIPPTEGEKIFEDAFVDKCRMLGMDETMIGRIDGDLPEGVFVVHAVDPAGGPEEGSDDTAIMTGLAGPPSYFLETLALPIDDARRVLALLPEHAMVIRVLWLTIGKMGAPEIKAAIADVHKRYGGFVMVEKNGVQKWMKQLLAVEYPEIVVHSWRTGGNKYDETLGIRAEANHFSVGMWIIPTRKTPEGALISEAPIEKFIRDLADYDPSGHTPDTVSAAWILRNAVRLYRPFGYEAAVAGDNVTKEELLGLGYSPQEIQDALPAVFDGGRAKKAAPARLIAGSELGPREPGLSDVPAAPQADDRVAKMLAYQKKQLEEAVRSIIRPTASDEVDEAELAEIESKYF